MGEWAERELPARLYCSRDVNPGVRASTSATFWNELFVLPKKVACVLTYIHKYKPKASVDNTNRGVDNFRYHAKPNSLIVSLCI